MNEIRFLCYCLIPADEDLVACSDFDIMFFY